MKVSGIGKVLALVILFVTLSMWLEGSIMDMFNEKSDLSFALALIAQSAFLIVLFYIIIPLFHLCERVLKPTTNTAEGGFTLIEFIIVISIIVIFVAITIPQFQHHKKNREYDNSGNSESATRQLQNNIFKCDNCVPL